LDAQQLQIIVRHHVQPGRIHRQKDRRIRLGLFDEILRRWASRPGGILCDVKTRERW
jgi:hypothetical protein